MKPLRVSSPLKLKNTSNLPPHVEADVDADELLVSLSEFVGRPMTLLLSLFLSNL